MPVADIEPLVLTLAAVALPVADIEPLVLTLAAVALPVADIAPPVLTLAAVTLPPAEINPLVVTLPPITLPATDNDWPVKLAVLTAVVNCPLLAVMLAVVVILVLAFNALSKLPLKLNPAAFKLPPVTLPLADSVCPVKLAVLTTVVNWPLLAVTLPVTDTVPPVKLAVLTAVVNCPLLAVMLAVVVILVLAFNALIKLPLKLNPAAFKLPPATFPDTLSDPPVKLATLTTLVNKPLLA